MYDRTMRQRGVLRCSDRLMASPGIVPNRQCGRFGDSRAVGYTVRGTSVVGEGERLQR